MKLQAVLFDLDDTLIDRRAAMRKYVSRFFMERFGSGLDKIDEEELIEKVHQADGGGYRGIEKFEELLEVLPWKERPTPEELDEHWQENFGKAASAMDGLFPMLEQLKAKGYKLGLITNGGTARQNEKVDVLGIRGYLDSVIVSDTVGLRKPDPQIFYLALNELGSTPEVACYIGDYPINDVIGAEQAGLVPIWRTGVHEWPSAYPEPKWQFAELAEVVPLLERLEQEG